MPTSAILLPIESLFQFETTVLLMPGIGICYSVIVKIRFLEMIRGVFPMSLRIRLARGGSKKRPFYKLVVAENTAPRDGKFIERLGAYNPLLEQGDPSRMVVVQERIEHWLSVGAKASDRVNKILAELGIIVAPIRHETPKKSAPKKKAQARLQEQQKAQ
ncbi:MAG: 30S ribosomal protein S16 [Holosporales bacterium]|jgi:small subunit ribosomal protein S16|nr:30S ribosomal protein S16 [Holosporales bacterium]